MSIPGYPESPARTPAQTRALVEVLNGHDLRRMMIVHGRSHAELQVIADHYRRLRASDETPTIEGYAGPPIEPMI